VLKANLTELVLPVREVGYFSLCVLCSGVVGPFPRVVLPSHFGVCFCTVATGCDNSDGHLERIRDVPT
jgi:hypothetical protein